MCRSFNDKPINENQVGPIGKVLFEQEQNDLLDDLKDIPRKACDRKVRAPQGMIFFTASSDLNLIWLIFFVVVLSEQINEFVKRARAAKIHACIMGHLKKEMPTMMGKAKAQQRLIDTLEDEFAKVICLYYTFPFGSLEELAFEVMFSFSICTLFGMSNWESQKRIRISPFTRGVFQK